MSSVSSASNRPAPSPGKGPPFSSPGGSFPVTARGVSPASAGMAPTRAGRPTGTGESCATPALVPRAARRRRRRAGPPGRRPRPGRQGSPRSAATGMGVAPRTRPCDCHRDRAVDEQNLDLGLAQGVEGGPRDRRRRPVVLIALLPELAERAAVSAATAEATAPSTCSTTSTSIDPVGRAVARDVLDQVEDGGGSASFSNCTRPPRRTPTANQARCLLVDERRRAQGRHLLGVRLPRVLGPALDTEPATPPTGLVLGDRVLPLTLHLDVIVRGRRP